MTVTGVCISVKVNGKLTGRNQALVSLLIKSEHHAMTQSEGMAPVFYNVWHYVEVSG